MNQLTKAFNGRRLRIVQNGENVHFLLRDVCDILQLGQVAGLIRRLRDEVISNHPIEDSLGRRVHAKFVNEDGLYDAIFESRKPEARDFRKWVTSEVLPSIRKHGAYMTPEKIEEALLNPDTIIKLATELKTEKERRHQVEQKRKIEEPYTNFGKAVSTSRASINVGAFAKMIYDEHGIKMGRTKMFKWLRDNGYLIRHGREWNNPKQKYIEQGLFTTSVTMVSRTQGDVESVTTLITGKGQVKLTEKLLQEFTTQEAI